MEAFKDEDIVVPDGVELNIDPDTVAGVEPNFQDITIPEEQQQGSEESPEATPAEATEPVAEPAPAPEPQSSVTDQPTEGPEPEPVGQPEPAPVAELSEEAVFKYLSETLGKEIKSFEDLVQPQANPLESDPDLKALAEWRERTGRPISDWAKFQKDYDAMSSEEVVREYLRYKYEDFTPEEIELEMQEYLPQEDDLDREAARKQLNLKKLAADGRKELNKLRMELNEAVPAQLTPEQSQAIEFYKQALQAQEQQKKVAQVNDQNLSKEIEQFDTIPLALEDGLEITFKPAPEARKTLREYMARPDWYNQDGTLNAKEVVKDSFFLQNRDAIIKEVYKQGVAAGQAIIEKKTSNTTLDGRKTADGEAPRQSDIIIEGLEDMYRSGPIFK